MDTLTAIARAMTWGLLIAWAAVISYQLLISGINTAGMLHTKGRHRDYSPARVQLLISTLAGAAYVLLRVFGGAPPHVFPSSSWGWLALLGGSHLTYLGSKAYALLPRRGAGADDAATGAK